MGYLSFFLFLQWCGYFLFSVISFPPLSYPFVLMKFSQAWMHNCIFHITLIPLKYKAISVSCFSCRRCISPYTKRAKKEKEKPKEYLRGHKSPLQSSVVSRRSELQDGSTHQIESVQRSDRISELVSYKSNTTNNFCLISPSKRNRPVSALPGHLR